MTDDINPLTVAERRKIQDDNRGRFLGFYSWRNFCCECGLPLVNHVEEKRYAKDLVCADCRPLESEVVQ